MSTKKTAKSSARSKPTKRTKADPLLATCPVNGAGWCPYPFSAAQLRKRMERLKKEQEQELVGAGAAR